MIIKTLKKSFIMAMQSAQPQKKQFETVLDAYASAYPSGLTILAKNADSKYYPTNLFDNKIVFFEQTEEQIKAMRDTYEWTQDDTVAFPATGFFQEKDVENAKTEDGQTTIDFASIANKPNEDEKEIAFHRVLTIIYGKKHNDTTYFFSPHMHIQKAYSLKDTVDIMIRSRDAAAPPVRA